MSSTRSNPLTTEAAHPDGVPRAPSASRTTARSWRDPRLAVGVALVAACVLLGARLLAAADDTVAVWSARHDLTAGAVLRSDDLVAVRVRLDGGTAGHYLTPGTELASGATLAHDVVAGELLPRSAVAADAARRHVEMPLSVALDDLPGSVREGAVVDVWVTPAVADPETPRPRARLALDDVVVVAVPSGGDSLAPQTTQQVIVALDEARAGEVPDALGLVADGRVVLTRQARP